MFKKLLTISLAVLVLIGCGKKEVTEDMLIGTWKCQYIDSKLSYKSGDELSPIHSLKIFYVSYIRKNEQLYAIKKDGNNEEELFDFTLRSNETIHPKDGSSMEFESQYNYVSNNEFNHIFEQKHFLPGNDNFEFKVSMTSNCRRDK